MRRTGATLLLILAAACAQAQVYRWTDAQGRVHYGDRKPADVVAETVKVDTRQPPVRVLQRSPPAPGTPPEPAPPAREPPPRITMYMSPSCGYCVRAAQLFQAHGLGWRNVDITASRRGKSEFEALGGRGTPLIFIDGVRFEGFNGPTLERTLARHGW